MDAHSETDTQEKLAWHDDRVILDRIALVSIFVLVFSLLTAIFGLG